ncbi:Chemotaxis protein CheY homolog [Candidatus Nitrosotenuis uzonensis]|uniref:Chemotaxis protein CheY homolog n=1 Tax=Candidatus Nitrosotenuis uzonensis TaxID=1407055 RepID=V6ATE5_9ARCH|nr:Chemotaxis protein CheY homolog [Candidatus Nitrosotenuis uzonensis]
MIALSEDWEPSILIVDDSHFTRRAIRKIIESNMLATKIIEAADGVEAVMKYKEHRPTLVTMDVLMPKADGIQALRAIKKIDPFAKVIMISSTGKSHIVQDSMRAGAIDYVLKPFDPAQIAITISKHGRI